MVLKEYYYAYGHHCYGPNGTRRQENAQVAHSAIASRRAVVHARVRNQVRTPFTVAMVTCNCSTALKEVSITAWPRDVDKFTPG